MNPVHGPVPRPVPRRRVVDPTASPRVPEERDWPTPRSVEEAVAVVERLERSSAGASLPAVKIAADMVVERVGARLPGYAEAILGRLEAGERGGILLREVLSLVRAPVRLERFLQEWWGRVRRVPARFDQDARVVEQADRLGILGKRPTGDQALRFVRWYLPEILGFRLNRYGSYDGPNDRRIKILKRTLQELRKRGGNWIKLDSMSTIDFADGVIRKAARQSGSTEQQEKVEGHVRKQRAKKKKAKAARRAKARQKAVQEYAWKLIETPDVREMLAAALGRGYLLPEEDRVLSSRAAQAADRFQLEWDEGLVQEIPRRDDALFSIGYPPLALWVDMATPFEYRWVEDGVPVRMWRPSNDRQVRVFLGSTGTGLLGVDPARLSVEVQSDFWDPGEVTTEGAYLNGTILLGRDAGLHAMLVQIVVPESQHRQGVATRLLRTWCRLLEAYGISAFPAMGVGEQGRALLLGLHEKGAITAVPIPGESTIAVRCHFQPEGQRSLFTSGPSVSLAEALAALDYALTSPDGDTGQHRREVEQAMRQRLERDPDLSEFLYGDLYYLSDGGYSRLGWDDQRQRVFLCSDPGRRVADRWGSVSPEIDQATAAARQLWQRLWESIE